jgi:hydrogenase expression/formation protein HypE
MHDPTEGGVATGLWELATAAGVGLEIDAEAVPRYPMTERLCDLYELDPWGVIASGSLLVAVAESDADPVRAALAADGIEAAVIGRVTAPERGVLLRTAAGRAVPLPAFERDEISRLFE